MTAREWKPGDRARRDLAGDIDEWLSGMTGRKREVAAELLAEARDLLLPVPAAGEACAATEDVVERARKVVADKVWEVHGPHSTDRDSAELDAEDIVAALAAANLLAGGVPGRSEAEIKAEALNEAADQIRLYIEAGPEGARSYPDWRGRVSDWLRARAARVAGTTEAGDDRG